MDSQYQPISCRGLTYIITNNMNPTLSIPGIAGNCWPGSPHHGGLKLSPAAETIPKAQNGQFMEMKEQLADNMALMLVLQGFYFSDKLLHVINNE